MRKIIQSVGNKSANSYADVCIVQRLINSNLSRLSPLLSLKVDGDCGPVTIGMIVEFQSRVMGLIKPNGRVDPGKKSIQSLNEYADIKDKITASFSFDDLLLQVQRFLKGSLSFNAFNLEDSKVNNLTEGVFSKAASLLGVEIAVIKAIAKIESSGSGFLSNGKPKILFEGHWFSKLTKSVYDAKNSGISHKKWTKKYYKGGVAEYSRYNSAKALDAVAAMKSTSWGKFQIMGFNYKKSGYASVEEFVRDMHKSEGHQLNALVNFLKSTKLDVHLKTKDWAVFAKGYNGPKYAENKYDIRLKQAYKAYSAGGK